MIRGRAWKYGKNIDTDAIYPARYLVYFEPAEVAKHAMEDVDPDFLNKAKPGDILVAETNFGTGSAREQAAMTLKFAGIGAVLADSFNRCFYRNAINNALPVLASRGISEQIDEGDDIEIDLEHGRIFNYTSGRGFQATPMPELLQRIISANGAIAYYRAHPATLPDAAELTGTALGEEVRCE
ncbi:MAG: 3-isopropylmalate dehydratase small subunit [Terracidiphilus sp.]|jgi:3-isopropylmalate/(R)-2-methylmalate dehydratase small subunit